MGAEVHAETPLEPRVQLLQMLGILTPAAGGIQLSSAPPLPPFAPCPFPSLFSSLSSVLHPSLMKAVPCKIVPTTVPLQSSLHAAVDFLKDHAFLAH